MSHDGIAICPMCARAVSTKNYRYRSHSVQPREGDLCRMSNQYTLVRGGSPEAFERRAAVVGDLAVQVQDSDCQVVWDYLTALPAAELQRLMVIALAAVPVDQTVAEMFSWVTDLPAAREVSA